MHRFPEKQMGSSMASWQTNEVEALCPCTDRSCLPPDQSENITKQDCKMDTTKKNSVFPCDIFSLYTL